MRTIKPMRYETPRVGTLEAHRIVELLGPVSCGSNLSPLPADEGFQRPGSAGHSNFSR
jgi:hypothetical protein